LEVFAKFSNWRELRAGREKERVSSAKAEKMKPFDKIHSIPTINTTFAGRISQFLTQMQTELLPVLREDLELELSPALGKVIRVLELVQVERFIPASRGGVGAPPKDRQALARAFVAKAVLNLPTIEGLIDRLQVDHALRRICGFDSRRRRKPKGRPKQGEVRVKEPTRLERQSQRTLAENLSELSKSCDVGSTKDSKGHKETWVGYKLHLNTADGDIPVAAILTSEMIEQETEVRLKASACRALLSKLGLKYRRCGLVPGKAGAWFCSWMRRIS